MQAAAIAGTIGGAALYGVGAVRGVWELALGGALLCLLGAIVAGVCSLLCWMDRHGRRYLESIAQQRSRLESEHARQAATLEAWQARLERKEADALSRTAGLSRLLKDLQGTLQSERETNRALRRELDDVTEDYNSVVVATMQERHSFFAAPRRTVARREEPARGVARLPNIPARPREPAAAEPTPGPFSSG